MIVHFEDTEYALLVDLADAYRTKPAVLVHRWALEKASAEWLSLSRQGKGGGSREREGDKADTADGAPKVP